MENQEKPSLEEQVKEVRRKRIEKLAEGQEVGASLVTGDIVAEEVEETEE